jgi:preprotein translocase subunit SecG
MENLVLIVHIIVSLSVIGLVLIQHGKGADAGAAFGGGSSGSVFGVQGSSNFLTRATSICVTIFFCTSIALAFIASSKHEKSSSLDIAVENAGLIEKDSQDTTDKNSVSNDIPN